MRRRPGSVTGSSPSTGSPEAWASRWRSVAPGGPAGSSRSTVPSSSATRSASPVRSFVTEAHGSPTSRGPCIAMTWSARATPAAAVPAPQPSMARSASTHGILGTWPASLSPRSRPTPTRSGIAGPCGTGGTSTSPEPLPSGSTRTIPTSRRSAVSRSSWTPCASSAPRPSTSSARGSTSSTRPTGRRSGARTARCSPRFAPPRRCSSSPARSIPPGRSRSRPTPSYPNETRDSGGPVRRRRPLGTDRRAEVHPSPVHASRGAGRRLCDRRRARARPARALLRRDAPRRRGQRAAPDRARLPLLGVLRRLHRAPRPLPSGGSGPGVRPRGRLDLAHRRRQPRGLHRLGDRGQPGRRTAARARPRRGAGRRLGRSECPDRQLRLPRARLWLGGTALLRGPAGGEDRVVGRDRDPAGPARSTLSSCKNGRYRPSMSDSLIPPSITGKGSHFPPGGSVLDHAFGASDPYTLGVEEEYMLLDGETFDLVQHIDTVLAAVAGHELEPVINPELMQSVLEIATPVCHTTGEIADQLRRIRGYVIGVARDQGMRVGSAGTHPFSLFERQRITAKDRYRAMVDQMQYIARRELIFGMHVHVAVDDAEKAIRVVNGLIAHLAELVALSASSPFWRGEPTGLRSSRHMVFAAFPRSGPPPRFPDYAEYAAVVNQLEKTGCIQDYTHIWWDIRLHPRLGTIEIRICDAVTRVEEAVALTAYCQALVKHFCERHERGEEIPSYHRILTTANKWRAARSGLEAPVMDLATGRRNPASVAQLVGRTLKAPQPPPPEL